MRLILIPFLMLGLMNSSFSDDNCLDCLSGTTSGTESFFSSLEEMLASSCFSKFTSGLGGYSTKEAAKYCKGVSPKCFSTFTSGLGGYGYKESAKYCKNVSAACFSTLIGGLGGYGYKEAAKKCQGVDTGCFKQLRNGGYDMADSAKSCK